MTSKLLRTFRALLARTLNSAPADRDSPLTPQNRAAAAMLLQRPAREDVLAAWRMLLGRDPPEDEIPNYLCLPTIAAVRKALMRSAEFRGIVVQNKLEQREHPDLLRKRPAYVFLHAMKAGGTSLRIAIDDHFPIERTCPIHFNELHQLPACELGYYDYFKGHFDYASLRFIPRDDLRIFCLFRAPRERLVSIWRSLQARPRDTGPAQSADSYVDLPIEEFFEHPIVRNHGDTHNCYLMTFGFSPSWLGREFPSPITRAQRQEALVLARQRIGNLAAIGITEQFDRSVRLICRMLDIPVPESVERHNVTDAKPQRDPRFRQAPPVKLTPRLSGALDELVEFDEQLYNFAVEEFERRCAALGID